ncbi:MAG TPA: outer membrane beta-barrel protein, partial [Dysgonamonadaceae bacterium]|nr:outer membrane beta-barrel protein [Dysgonamonadaceae bacterium]
SKLPTQIAEHQIKQQTTTPTHKEDKSLITKKESTKIEKSTPPLLADNSSLLQQKTSTSNVIREKEEEKTTIDISDKASHTKDNVATSKKQESAQEKDKTSDIDEETKQKMIQDFINEGKRSSNTTDEAKTAKKRSKHAISLSGRSSFSSSQQTNTMPTTLRKSVSDSYGMYTMSKMKGDDEEANVNPKSKKIHRQPVSFGVLTSFDITDKLQVETGLIYTYLSSQTENSSDNFNNGEKTQFHYLGVPVNLNYTILSINKLNMYLTGGVMIEKDLYGQIKYNDEQKPASLNSGYTIEKSSKINQKNPQLSVAGGVGLTYPIYNKTKLFGKLGGRYYINAKNEYETYYSDEKFGLDIQLGIKFNF